MEYYILVTNRRYFLIKNNKKTKQTCVRWIIVTIFIATEGKPVQANQTEKKEGKTVKIEEL